MAVAGTRTRILVKSAAHLRRAAGFGLLATMALLSGCSPGSRAARAPFVPPASAATPETPSDASAAPRPPADGDSEIDALLHDLRVQKERVDRELARKEQLAVARAEEAETAAEPDAAPSRAPKPRASAPSKKKDAPAAGAPPAAPTDDADGEPGSDWVGSPCDTACRALASMERSAERICALAGEGEARCESARAMVKASRERVQTSGCWCRSFAPR